MARQRHNRRYVFQEFFLEQPEVFWAWKGFSNLVAQFFFADDFLVSVSTPKNKPRYLDITLVPCRTENIFWGKDFIKSILRLMNKTVQAIAIIVPKKTIRELEVISFIKGINDASIEKINDLEIGDATSFSHLQSCTNIGIITDRKNRLRFIFPVSSNNYPKMDYRKFDPSLQHELDLLQSPTILFSGKGR